jgi:hypothetical protein
MAEPTKAVKKPGVCIPWEERIQEYPKIMGDPDIVRKAWEDMDMLAYLYVWFTLTLF